MYFLQGLLTRHLTIGFAASLKRQFQASVLYSQITEVGMIINSHIISISLLLYSYNNFHFQDKTYITMDSSIHVDTNYKPKSRFLKNYSLVI